MQRVEELFRAPEDEELLVPAAVTRDEAERARLLLDKKKKRIAKRNISKKGLAPATRTEA
jgi:hypothetical protein